MAFCNSPAHQANRYAILRMHTLQIAYPCGFQGYFVRSLHRRFVALVASLPNREMHSRIAHTRWLKDNARLVWKQEKQENNPPPPSSLLVPKQEDSPWIKHNSTG